MVFITLAVVLVTLLIVARGRYPASPPERSSPRDTSSLLPPRTGESPTPLQSYTSSIPPGELPNLYPGTQWTTPKSAEYPFVTLTGEGKFLDGFGLESTALVDSPNDFLEHYQRELARGGWTFLEVAGDEVYSYAKGESLFMYRYDEITEGEGLSRHVVGYKLFVQYN